MQISLSSKSVFTNRIYLFLSQYKSVEILNMHYVLTKLLWMHGWMLIRITIFKWIFNNLLHDEWSFYSVIRHFLIEFADWWHWRWQTKLLNYFQRISVMLTSYQQQKPEIIAVSYICSRAWSIEFTAPQVKLCYPYGEGFTVEQRCSNPGGMASC